MNRKILILIIPLLIITGCQNQEETASPENIIAFSTSPTYLEEICLANEQVKEFVDNFSKGSSQSYQGLGDIYYPKPVVFSWSSKESYKSYKIKISRDQQFSDSLIFETNKNEIVVDDLFVDSQYFWKIFAYDDNEKLIGNSETFTFSTLAYPRTIRVDGVSNSRDIGGKMTIEGKEVKQGMVYRSANLDYITDEGIKKFKEVYKIKTDLDLRTQGEGLYRNMSPLGRDINYINVTGCYWTGGTNGLDILSNFSRVRDELKVFANIENYPICFHCAIGQDRTGSLAFVLGALLGVEGRDLLIDYELSSFSSAVWDPSNKIWVTDKLKYQYMPLYDYINSFDTDEDSLMCKAENYCEEVGLTCDEIDSIRSNLLEG